MASSRSRPTSGVALPRTVRAWFDLVAHAAQERAARRGGDDGEAPVEQAGGRLVQPDVAGRRCSAASTTRSITSPTGSGACRSPRPEATAIAASGTRSRTASAQRAARRA